jgi:hypothetical protein
MEGTRKKLEDNVKDGETRLKRIYVQWGQKTCRQFSEIVWNAEILY